MFFSFAFEEHMFWKVYGRNRLIHYFYKGPVSWAPWVMSFFTFHFSLQLFHQDGTLSIPDCTNAFGKETTNVHKLHQAHLLSSICRQLVMTSTTTRRIVNCAYSANGSPCFMRLIMRQFSLFMSQRKHALSFRRWFNLKLTQWPMSAPMTKNMTLTATSYFDVTATSGSILSGTPQKINYIISIYRRIYNMWKLDLIFFSGGKLPLLNSLMHKTSNTSFLCCSWLGRTTKTYTIIFLWFWQTVPPTRGIIVNTDTMSTNM